MGVIGDLYRFGLFLGIKSCLKGNPRLGFKSLLNPVRSGYSRYLEIPYLLNHLADHPSRSILDIGSPKHAALYISRKGLGCIRASDLNGDFISDYQYYADTLNLKNLTLETADGTALKYKSDSFNLVYAISVLEHIPGQGDSMAMQEIRRVLKPGGWCILTLPFAPKEEDIFWDQAVYGKPYQGKPNFFCRLYDPQTLQKRIVQSSKLIEKNRRYFTQKRFHFINLDNPRNSLWSRLPPFFYLFIHPFGPIMAKILLASAQPYEISQKIPGTVCLSLQKVDED